jgi:molecular chaperone DnaJ
MATRDYYAVLGVSRMVNADGIRRAFKERALEYHPDRAGPEATEAFQSITEAYRVLSDQGARTAYDDTLRAEPDLSRPVAMDRRAEEVLSFGPLSLFRDFHGPGAAVAEMFDRVMRNFTGIGVPKAERRRALDLELIMSEEEAERGCAVSIGVPTSAECVACGGSGRQWLYPCKPCGESGFVEDELPVTIRIPPLVADGTIFEIPLDALGVHNLALRLGTRVAR